jgi:hypothetical protein
MFPRLRNCLYVLLSARGCGCNTTGRLPTSMSTSAITWTSHSLIAGLGEEDPSLGHRDHQTSLPWTSFCGGTSSPWYTKPQWKHRKNWFLGSQLLVSSCNRPRGYFRGCGKIFYAAVLHGRHWDISGARESRPVKPFPKYLPVYSSETSVKFYRTRQRHISKDCENLKSGL